MIRSPLFIGASSERERATRIGSARLLVGATLLAPGGLGRRLFRVPESHDNQTTRLLGRLFGIRNVVLGTWALLARDQDVEQRRLCYRLNAAVDAADVVALVWAMRQDPQLRIAGMMSTALGTSALLAWLELMADAG